MNRYVQVKAWCYYESRLLGAHHGLISTYALETMVLYIFNLYHTQLPSPLRARHSAHLQRPHLGFGLGSGTTPSCPHRCGRATPRTCTDLV